MLANDFDKWISAIDKLDPDQRIIARYWISRLSISKVEPTDPVPKGKKSIAKKGGGHGSQYSPEELAAIKRLIIDKQIVDKAQFRYRLKAFAERFGRNANAVNTKVNETIRESR